MKKQVILVLAAATVLFGSLSSVAEAGSVRDRLRKISDEKRRVYDSKKAISNTADFLEQRLGSETGVQYDKYVAIPDSEAARKRAQYSVWKRVSAQYETAKQQAKDARAAMNLARNEWLAAERSWQLCPPGK